MTLRGLLFTFVLALASLAAGAEPTMRAHFIDVGQGASALLEFPKGAILIDTGAQDDEHVQRLGNVLQRFFSRRTDLNSTLNTLFITHPHIDHTRGIKAVLNVCKVQCFVDDGFVNGSGGSTVRFILKFADENGFPSIRPVLDDEIVSLPELTGVTDDLIDSIAGDDCDPQIRVLSGGLSSNPRTPFQGFL